MASMTTEAIISATNDLFREFGFNGTSIKQIVKASETTTGSVYHFYPGGKDELAIAVMSTMGQRYQQTVEVVMDQAADLPTGIYAVFEQAADLLERTDFLDPCPIGGVAREVANVKPALRAAISEVFLAGSQAVEARLRAAGLAAGVAQDIANTFVAAIEGGFILARTHRSREPLLGVGRTLRAVVAAEL